MAKRRRPTKSRTTRSDATQEQTPQDLSAGEDTVDGGATEPETPSEPQDGTTPNAPADDTPASATDAAPDTDRVTPDEPAPSEGPRSVSEAEAPESGGPARDATRPGQSAERADDDGMPQRRSSETEATPEAAAAPGPWRSGGRATTGRAGQDRTPPADDTIRTGEGTTGSDTPSAAGDTPSTTGDTLSTADDTLSASGDTPSASGDTLSSSGDTLSTADDTLSTADDTLSGKGDTTPSGSDTISPDKGDFSVAPVGAGPLPEGDTAAPAPGSAERSDTLAGSRSGDTAPGSRSGDTAPGGRSGSTSSGSRTAEAGAAAATATPAARETVVERRGGFVPMLLGGILAAAIGFGLSQYLGPNGWPFSSDGSLFEDETRAALGETQSGLEDTRTGLEDLGARIDGIESDLTEVDFGEMQQIVATLTGAVEEIRAELEGLDAAVTAMDGTAGTLADRVTAIEKAPMEDAVSPETVAAYERELEELQARVEEQNAAGEQAAADRQAQMEEAFAGMQGEIEEQRAEIRAMLDEAQSAEQDAQRQAELATLRTAAADLLTAVRTGDPYAEALQPIADAEGVEVPEALSGPAGDGVPTQAELVDSYPEAARAGLAAARTEESGTGLQAFMARQLGARSVTPRDGDSPDAILSRAEAAVNGGDVQAALDEISALPQAAQDAMSDWIGQARTRAEAVAAADGLVQELNQQ